MSDLKVEVIGAKPRRQKQRTTLPVSRWVRAAMMRPRLLSLAGVAAFLVFVGTPHAGWDYECRHHKSHGQPCHSVSYCAYYGVQGRRVVFPSAREQCQMISFLPLDWRKLFR